MYGRDSYQGQHKVSVYLGVGLLQSHDVTWRTVCRKVGRYQLQVVRKLVPPVTQVLGLFLNTVEELVLGTLPHWVVNVYQDLIQDLR